MGLQKARGSIHGNGGQDRNTTCRRFSMDDETEKGVPPNGGGEKIKKLKKKKNISLG